MEFLADKSPIRGMRQYYHRSGPPDPDRRETIPTGFWVQQIGPELLAEKNLENFKDM